MVCWHCVVGKRGFVDPHVVPSLHVVPPGLNLIVSCPHESGINIVIERFEGASGDSLNLGAIEECRVRVAFAFLNANVG